MDLQPKTEPGSPPGFGSSSHRNLNEMSVSELVSELRITFRVDVFDRIEEVLVARDARLKAEIASHQEKIEVERMNKIQVEEELKKREEQCQKGKRAQEYYEKLLKEVKKSGLHDLNTIEELRNKNREFVAEICKLKELKKKLLDDSNAVADLRIRVRELEDQRVELEAGKKNVAENYKSAIYELRAENTRLLNENHRLEALVESKERKFWELNERVLRLEDDIKLLMSVGASGGGGNTDGEPQADPEELKELKEMDVRGCNAGSDPLHRNEDTRNSLGAGIVQCPSKVNKDASARGRSGLENIIEIKDSDDDDDDDDDQRRKKNLSTWVKRTEILKRKFSFSDTSSSSSSSDLPLNFYGNACNKRNKTEGDSPASNSLPR